MKRVMFVSLLLAALVAPAAVHAQVVVPRGQTFGVEWNSQYPNDAAVMRFQTFVDNTLTKTWTSAELTVTAAPLADCFGTATPPAGAQCFLYRGTHPSLNNTGSRRLTVWVTEMASGLNSARSTEVVFTVGTVPNTPTNPRVVVTTTQAGVTFEFKSAPVTVAQSAAAPAERTTVTVKVPSQK